MSQKLTPFFDHEKLKPLAPLGSWPSVADWLIDEAKRDHDYVEWYDAYLQARRMGLEVSMLPAE